MKVVVTPMCAGRRRDDRRDRHTIHLGHRQALPCLTCQELGDDADTGYMRTVRSASQRLLSLVKNGDCMCHSVEQSYGVP